jgi:hypothetical protein
MKRLLAISWEMPPLTGPRAVQVTRTLVALAQLGWRSDTVSFSPRSHRYQQDDDPISIEERSAGMARLIPVESPEEWFMFRALWRVAPALKQLPDEKRVWINAALRAARASLDLAPADVIVSFAQPWSDHLIGLRLKRERRLPWVAHFSDPWVDSPYFHGPAAVRRLAGKWEREVITEADRIVFVNSYARDRVMAKYPAGWIAKTAVVPQGHVGQPSPSSSGDLGERPLQLVYTGRFYDGVRSPETFLRALAAAGTRVALDGKLEVHFVGGAMSPYAALAKALKLERVAWFHGRLAPRKAVERASTADVLLLIDAPSRDGASLFLPSKLIEYLPLRKPIVGITPAAGPSADLLREMGYPIVAPDDEAAIAELLFRLVTQPRHDLTASPQHDSVTARFHIEETTRAFATVLDEACRAR